MRLEQNLVTLWFSTKDEPLTHGGGSLDIETELRSNPKLHRRMLLLGLLHNIKVILGELGKNLQEYNFLKPYLDKQAHLVEQEYQTSPESEIPGLDHNQRILDFVFSDEYHPKLFEELKKDKKPDIKVLVSFLEPRVWELLFLDDPIMLLQEEPKDLYRFVEVLKTLFPDHIKELLSSSKPRKKLPPLKKERLLILQSLFESMTSGTLNDSQAWLRERGLHQEKDFLKEEGRSRR